MSRAKDRELLVEFGDWLHPRIGLEVWHREIDAFLAERESQATAQRYWRVHRPYRATGNIAWECDGHGKTLCRLTPICGTHSAGRDTLAEAIADGRASGLPEWRPDAIPAALPPEETKK